MERMRHWDRVSPQKEAKRRIGAYYQKLLIGYYRFMVPQGLRVLELGCGHGDLLAALRPSFGVGVDFSGEMIRMAIKRHPEIRFVQADAHSVAFKEKFDIIILSDLVNDIWDSQQLFETARSLSHSGTRLVLNFYNNLWRFPLSLVKKMGLGANMLEQNWFQPQDIVNLLNLSGFERINSSTHILFPLKIPLIAKMMNRYLAHLLPFCWFALTYFVIAKPRCNDRYPKATKEYAVSVVIPARNEAGNIQNILKRVPEMGSQTELIFIEGGSTDKTYETIQTEIDQFPDVKSRLFRQSGKGKGDAVRLGFKQAEGDILMILDADMTVPPEDLPRFYNALTTDKGEFINGVRLIYPLENQSMRMFNIIGNKFFSLTFSWLLGQPIKDTLCGTKVIWKHDYEMIRKGRSYFGNFDPFGDFDLLFGAAKNNLKIAELPIRYRSRTYGSTNIDRWRHGWLLLKMVAFAGRRIKFI